MSFILNIGLKTNDGKDLNATDTLRIVNDYGFKVTAQSIQFSTTERTLVVFCTGNLNAARLRIDRLAQALQQDCIAAYSCDQHYGELIGPKASDWGDFNPSFFLLLDGTTLTTTPEGACV